jgi:tripartite ATP-independent transporter DctM subunit
MTATELLAPVMFACAILLLLAGFPVAFTLAGVSVLFAFIGAGLGVFEVSLLSSLPLRLIGLMENDLLQAIPIFVFLGVVLQKTTIAGDLLEAMSGLFGKRPGGLGISTLLIGALLAPMTGAVGATVLTMGMLTLPTMLNAGYDKRLASGIVCAAGTLGTILPPSVILILLATMIQSGYVEAMARIGRHISSPLLTKHIYLGALLPVGLLLVLYIAYVAMTAWWQPHRCPPVAMPAERPLTVRRVLVAIAVPVGLIVGMLGAIVTGWIYTVEAAASGAILVSLLAFARGELTLERFADSLRTVMRLTAMVFALMIGALTFTLVFRGLEGDLTVARWLAHVPGGPAGATAAAMLVAFVTGFFLDATEIILLVVPVAAVPLLALDVDPIWLSVLLAVNLQTSFLAPPAGFALNFVRTIAPPGLGTGDIYRGALPMIGIQLVALVLLWAAPQTAISMAGRPPNLPTGQAPTFDPSLRVDPPLADEPPPPDMLPARK